MSRFEDALQEHTDAVWAEFQAEKDGPVPEHITSRRIAAIRHLHAAIDPWRDCHCPACEGLS